DWFINAQKPGVRERSQHQLGQMVPTAVFAPSMTKSAHDIHHGVSDFFKRERSIFVFANACGPVRSMNGACCGTRRTTRDLRSFIAAPKDWYTIESLCETPIDEVGHVPAVRAACRNQRTNDNTVIASIRLKDRDS
ncbi:MAG: hypothetical protein KKB20_03065, partial [Proteobacteria bacterium]|nr:hypothetical protein [Pseudomonadota bacterium]